MYTESEYADKVGKKKTVSAKEAAEKAIVDDATIERFGKQLHCVNHSFDKNGRNVWSTGFKRISAKEAAELVAHHGWTLDEYVAAKTHWQKKVDADEFFSIMQERGACTIDDTPDLDPDEYIITPAAFNVAIKAEEYNAYVADITEQILSDPVTDAAYRAAKERVEVTFSKCGYPIYRYRKTNGEWTDNERVAKAYISKCGLSETSFIVKAKHDVASGDNGAAVYDAPELDGSEEDIDADKPFDLLPTLDELQDVDDMPLVAGEKIHADKRFNTYKVNGEVIHFDKGVWYLIESDKYGVKLCRDEGVITWDIKNIDGRRLKVDCTEAEFWRAMIERGGCTIDLTDAEKLTAKLKEVTRKARLMEIYPQDGGRTVDNLHKVEVALDGDGFIFTNVYETLARYDNREQCQDVIERIKTAIDGCDTEFEFPTAELVDLERKLPALMIEDFNRYKYRSKGRSIPRRFLAAQLKYYGLTASDLRKYKTA